MRAVAKRAATAVCAAESKGIKVFVKILNMNLRSFGLRGSGASKMPTAKKPSITQDKAIRWLLLLLLFAAALGFANAH
ncbi:hypothetical protein COX86_03620 [Candidatus Micrarchaeota archaeon CG_4_10_14_0_2_um_filter_60_11]|nr:MAG: hypothetical protein AUJ16_03065 [Candidatus Micrarchaeota archaeon CG1_02_60_51]PIO02368.1 MAG: hypothetical protein COT58_00640 [Candidatus Micrarchaeota archaeon CG09_land_8_20_14_0_10_60_16]PIY91924.1 MAG: hypothetical protein COY71_00465 [Candidatus Micrarchaeota archaeon CG_4_10_14_0_8_um_filter_60_7]PIZ90718.1 MAG: hypothetical protein COX86_03620 [Candidatus Micrarchaeota archaeon CG_4_10_14_0_2_um_filter_60_11]